MYRILRDGVELPVVVRTIKEVLAVIRSGEPGRYRIVELDGGTASPDQASRHWGVGVRNEDGTLKMEFGPSSS
jgi:hypothetical protein